jgi:hypothetical protein
MALFGLSLDGIGTLPGLGVMAFGGGATVVASGVQVVGGMAQIWDDASVGRANIYVGAANITVGGAVSWVGSSLMRSGISRVARDANTRVESGLAMTGAIIDVASDALPNMSPTLAACSK